MSLFETLNKNFDNAKDTAVSKQLEEVKNFLSSAKIDVSKLSVSKDGEKFKISGTLEEGEMIDKLNTTLENSSLPLTASIELEDLRSRNISLTVKTKGSNLNVRNKPSTDSDIVGKFPNGTNVTLVKKTQKDWYEVTNGELSGYCHTDFLK